jgi:hypothetical protein
LRSIPALNIARAEAGSGHPAPSIQPNSQCNLFYLNAQIRCGFSQRVSAGLHRLKIRLNILVVEKHPFAKRIAKRPIAGRPLGPRYSHKISGCADSQRHLIDQFSERHKIASKSQCGAFQIQPG